MVPLYLLIIYIFSLTPIEAKEHLLPPDGLWNENGMKIVILIESL